MEKRNVNLILSLVIMLVGLLTILSPWYKGFSNYFVFIVTMATFCLVKLAQFLFNDEKQDKEDLFMSLISFVIWLFCIIKGEMRTIESYPLLMIVWFSLYAIIRLIKVDYLHDNNDKKFQKYLFNSVVFLLIGIASSLSLYYSETSSTFILGYLSIIYGLMSINEDYSFKLLKG